MKHKAIPKKTRQLVYEKYNGHCAYCGCELEYKDMQVDHATSVLSTTIMNHALTQDDSMENLMPSCRQCNFYKSASGIKGFRKKIKDILSRTCIDTVQARLALKYGILTHRPWDGRFYFERMGEEDGIPEDVIEYLQKETGMETQALKEQLAKFIQENKKSDNKG